MKRKQQYIVTTLLLALFFCVSLPGTVLATENVETDAAIPKPAITRCEGVSYNTIGIMTTIPDSAYDCEIYRATSKNGKYRLVDKLEMYGTSWSSSGDGYWVANCKKGKISCIRAEDTYIFVDTKLKFGKKYYYQLRFTDDEENGAFSKKVSAQGVLEAPSIYQGVANTSNKPKLTFDSVDGAQGYIVYRKSGSKWKRIATLKGKNKTNYTDTKASSGKTYSYRVKAYRTYNGKKKLSSYSNTFKVSTKTPKVSGTYTSGSVYGPSLNSTELMDVKKAVYSFKLNYIRKSMSDFEKVAIAYQYLRATCSYAYRGWQYNRANTAWGALVYGEAQCSGYARAMKALCDAIDIPCYYIHANSQSANPSHQWNQVKVDGKWYILDAQGGIFLVSGDYYASMTGMRWDTSKYPKCKSNYIAED